MSHTAPLEAIRQKEAELNQRLAEARQQAEADVAAAKEAARSWLQQAEIDGVAQAKRLYSQGIAQANQQAADILADAQIRVESLRCRAEGNMAAATRQLVEVVLKGERPC